MFQAAQRVRAVLTGATDTSTVPMANLILSTKSFVALKLVPACRNHAGSEHCDNELAEQYIKAAIVVEQGWVLTNIWHCFAC